MSRQYSGAELSARGKFGVKWKKLLAHHGQIHSQALFDEGQGGGIPHGFGSGEEKVKHASGATASFLPPSLPLLANAVTAALS